MQEKEVPDEEFKIPLGDIVKALKKNRRTILLSSMAAAALFGVSSLFSPIRYLGEATFKEKSNSHTSMSTSSVADFLLSGFSPASQSDAKTMMSSRKLMQDVVKSLNLQALIEESGKGEGILIRPWQNLQVEYNHLRKSHKYPLQDRSPQVLATQIAYSGEFPLPLRVSFNSKDTFDVFDREQKKISSGRIDSPFITREFSFTLSRQGSLDLKGKTFDLTLLPLQETAKSLAESIKIASDKEDPSLLKLTYRNRDRILACKVLNELMSAYQNYLKSEQHRIYSEQISYLNRREEEIGDNLKRMVEAYAAKISSELSTAGYVNSERALDFFTGQLQRYKEKTIVADLMLKRLTRVLDEDPETQMDAYLQQGTTNPTYIDNLLEAISRIKQESDSLELAIRERGAQKTEEWQASFQTQVSEIEEIRKSSSGTAKLIAQLENGTFPDNPHDLLEASKYMITPWIGQLQEIENDWKLAPLGAEKEMKREEWIHFREQFMAYLYNLSHYLEVRERSIRERLSHQQTPQTDFQGINLPTATELYKAYVQQQSELQSQILQYNFLIEELKNPNLEISSLSSMITDDVTRRLVDSASKLVLAMQDDSNRSAKEKERMKTELEIERKFLSIHLRQTIDLLNLKIELVKDKIASLQKANLELLHQQMSVLEKQLRDSIRTHIRNLREERKLIAENENELKQEMSVLPQKWASEKMIEQKLKLNSTMVEEITKLVESKNIASNLEMIQSAPVDPAIPRVRPERPHILLFTLLGALLGAIFSSAGLIVANVARGFPASKESLELAGLHVSGTITSDKAANREAIKSLSRFLNRHKASSASILFAQGGKQGAAIELAAILQRQGEEVLLLKVGSGIKGIAKEEPAAPFKWLSEKVENMPIEKGASFSELSVQAPFQELLATLSYQKFQNFLKTLKTHYNFVIAESDCPVEDVKEMISLFDFSAITLSNTPMAKLQPLIQTLKDEGKESVTSFLIVEDKIS